VVVARDLDRLLQVSNTTTAQLIGTWDTKKKDSKKDRDPIFTSTITKNNVSQWISKDIQNIEPGTFNLSIASEPDTQNTLLHLAYRIASRAFQTETKETQDQYYSNLEKLINQLYQHGARENVINNKGETPEIFADAKYKDPIKHYEDPLFLPLPASDRWEMIMHKFMMIHPFSQYSNFLRSKMIQISDPNL